MEVAGAREPQGVRRHTASRQVAFRAHSHALDCGSRANSSEDHVRIKQTTDYTDLTDWLRVFFIFYI